MTTIKLNRSRSLINSNETWYAYDSILLLGFLFLSWVPKHLGVVCEAHVSLGKLGRNGWAENPCQHPKFLLRLLGGKLEVWALWSGAGSHKQRCGLYRRDSEQAKIRGMDTVPEFWELTPPPTPPVSRDLGGAELYPERTGGCCMLMHPCFHPGQCSSAKGLKVSLGDSWNRMPFQMVSQLLVQFSEGRRRLNGYWLVLLGGSAPLVEGQKLTGLE